MVGKDQCTIADADIQPRIYRMGLGWRAAGILLGSVMSAGSLLEIAHTIVAPSSINKPIFLGVFCIVGIILGSYIVLSTIKFKVILNAHWIEVSGIFKTRRVERKDIGAKIFTILVVPLYTLIPWSKRQRPFTIYLTFRPDQTLASWLASIPDADATFLRNRRRGSP